MYNLTAIFDYKFVLNINSKGGPRRFEVWNGKLIKSINVLVRFPSHLITLITCLVYFNQEG